MAELGEFFLSSDHLDLSDDKEDNLIWKTILRTGEWKVRPNANHPKWKGKPLRVVRHSGDTNAGEVGLQDLYDAFNDGAVENVTIPLARGKDRTSHDDLTIDNTGYIKKLKIVDGSDGISRLVAGHEFTEPEIAEKVKRRSIAGNSVGIVFDHQRTEDGKKYKAALVHSALTNRPWINGMEPFGVAASEEDIEVFGAEFDETQKPPIDLDDPPVWDQTNSRNYIMNSLNEQFNGDSSVYKVIDVGLDSALVHDTAMNSAYIAPYTTDSTGTTDIKLSPYSQWVYTKTIIPDESEVVSDNTDLERDESASAETPATPSGVESKPASPPLHNTPEQKLQESQRKRAMLLAENRKHNTNGGKIMTDLNLDQLGLSDEQREAIEQIQAEATELRAQRDRDAAELREAKVKDRIAELEGMGLDQFPGFLKVAREVYLSDDGGEAILLSEEGSSSKTNLTASQIADRLIDALPKKDGKIVLAEQILAENDDGKPADDASEELSREDKVKQAEEFLYSGTSKKTKQRVGVTE